MWDTETGINGLRLPQKITQIPQKTSRLLSVSWHIYFSSCWSRQNHILSVTALVFTRLLMVIHWQLIYRLYCDFSLEHFLYHTSWMHLMLDHSPNLECFIIHCSVQPPHLQSVMLQSLGLCSAWINVLRLWETHVLCLLWGFINKRLNKNKVTSTVQAVGKTTLGRSLWISVLWWACLPL